MKDEIKEILSKMERLIVYGQYNAYYNLEKQILDYITNLQEAFEKSYTEEQLDFAVNEVKEQLKAEHQLNNQLHNEIDKLRVKNYELQEENERLKEENKRIFSHVNDDQLLRSNAMNWAEAQDYKSRNEKAIEYIKNSLNNPQPFYEYIFGDEDGNVENLDKLLNILQGSDKE